MYLIVAHDQYSVLAELRYTCRTASGRFPCNVYAHRRYDKRGTAQAISLCNNVVRLAEFQRLIA